MKTWKVAAAAVAAAVIGAAIFYGPTVLGQERRAPQARVWSFQTGDWFGGQIGITVHDSETGAVVVDDVRAGSPAEKAGVKEKDVISEFDGERVRSAKQFSRLVEETAQGRSAKMTVQRGGQRMTLDVTPEARQFGRLMPAPLERFTLPRMPDLPAMPRMREFDYRNWPEFDGLVSRSGRLGVQLEDVEDQLAEYFGVKSGALVAARAGIKAGDVITKVNGEPVDNTGAVRRELRRIEDDREFAVDVVRDRKPLSLKVKLEPRPTSATRRPGTVTD
jgi:serine protease Do